MAETAEIRQLKCKEIWGGSKAVTNAVSTPGMDIRVDAQPFMGQAFGGDIYFCSMCGAGAITRMVLADVAGHGQVVADLSNCLYELMLEYINIPDQRALVDAMNKAFCRLTTDGRFATAIVATYWAPTDELLVCNAGHPRPLWYRAAKDYWQFLEPASPDLYGPTDNLPLGVFEDTAYRQFAVSLKPEDLIFMYTDAVIEARNTVGDLLGENGLLATVRSMSPNSLCGVCGSIVQTITETHHVKPGDDQTMLVIHHNAANPPDLPAGLYDQPAPFGDLD